VVAGITIGVLIILAICIALIPTSRMTRTTKPAIASTWFRAAISFPFGVQGFCYVMHTLLGALLNNSRHKFARDFQLLFASILRSRTDLSTFRSHTVIPAKISSAIFARS